MSLEAWSKKRYFWFMLSAMIFKKRFSLRIEELVRVFMFEIVILIGLLVFSLISWRRRGLQSSFLALQESSRVLLVVAKRVLLACVIESSKLSLGFSLSIWFDFESRISLWVFSGLDFMRTSLFN